MRKFVGIGVSTIENTSRLERNPFYSQHLSQFGCGFGHIAVFARQMSEAQACKVYSPVAEHLGGYCNKVPAEDDLFSFLNSLIEQGWRDGALVDIEEGYVVVRNLMEQDDELNEVGVCLLPERLLATTEKIVQERCDIEGESVRVQVTTEWVVTEFGVEADFNIVVTPSVTIENLLHLSAKITLDLQNQTPNPLRRIVSFIS